MKRRLQRQLKDIEAQVSGLLERVVETANPRVVAAYEAKIDALERQKLLLSEKLATSGQPQRPFAEMFELALRFFANPYNIWEKGDLALRRAVLRLVFEGRVAYCRKDGLRTPKTTLPFKMLEGMCAHESQMAGRMGFEPTRPFWGLLP